MIRTLKSAKGRAMAVSDLDLGNYKLGWNDGDEFVYRPNKGISETVVQDISAHKSEPE